jgi:hypothetical protein
MLEGDIKVGTDPRLAEELEQPVRDLFRIAVENADPGQAFHLEQSLEERRQAVTPADVAAEEG